MATSVEIFCCYTRTDKHHLNRVKAHLMMLQRQERITIWADTDISAGTEWEKEIEKHLNTAQIILLLISPDFIASEYCYSKEMTRAMERQNKGEARVVPVILSLVASWQNAPFGRLQALPTDALPVDDSSWGNIEKAYSRVAEGIEKVVEELEQLRGSHTVSPIQKPIPEPLGTLQERKPTPQPDVQQKKKRAPKSLSIPSKVFLWLSKDTSPYDA